MTGNIASSFTDNKTPGKGGLNVDFLNEHPTSYRYICFSDVINIYWRYGQGRTEWNIALVASAY
jgi:hypothetical protein